MVTTYDDSASENEEPRAPSLASPRDRPGPADDAAVAQLLVFPEEYANRGFAASLARTTPQKPSQTKPQNAPTVAFAMSYVYSGNCQGGYSSVIPTSFVSHL